MPFSADELKAVDLLSPDPFENLVKGFYPPIYNREMHAYDWYTNYIAAYVERDVRSILNIKDLGQYQTFLKLCAARTGQILNLNALALDCGISHNTARSWLSTLETSGIVYLLRPYHKNFGKRLVKSPTLYFTDSGLNARLLGIKTVEDLFLHPNRGNSFESYVVSELLKNRYNEGLDADIYFWRDNTGTEIDIVFEKAQTLKAVAIKSSKTFTPEATKNLEIWMKYSGAKPADCSVVYAGNLRARSKDMAVLPWDDIGSLRR